MKKDIAILGAGMAGYGAAYCCEKNEVPCTVYDKRPDIGGHTSTFSTENGFLFDEGPHISFTKDEGMQDFLANAVDGEYETVQARFNNYWNGYWIKHPAQVNLHGLPENLLIDIIRDYFEAYHNPPPRETIHTFEDWLKASYGDTFAETFPMVYGKKYHTVDASKMSTDWLGPRLYTPEPEEVLHGLLSDTTPDVHYIDHFRYPKEGGFQTFLEQFRHFSSPTIHTNHRVTRINPATQRITFADGTVREHSSIISSIPLPEMIKIIEGVPDDVREAARKLACSTVVLVSLGVDRLDLSDAHISYFYDTDISFSRLTFQHMLSPGNAPPGMGSVQAEVYFSDKYKPLTTSAEALIPIVINDLKKTGVLREDDTIIDQDARSIKYANIIFDLDRADAVETVHGYLDDIGIRYCGRYGDWGYMWTDQSFRSGEQTMETVLENEPISV